jgi:hypothetical protein
LNDVLREGITRVARAAAAGSDEADVVKAQRWCARMALHKDTPKDCRSATRALYIIQPTFLRVLNSVSLNFAPRFNLRDELSELAQ